MRIKINSSESIGTLGDAAYVVDLNGVILENYDSGDVQIHKFDVAEYGTKYGQIDSEIDILDIGYWHGEDSAYEPPAADFRDLQLQRVKLSRRWEARIIDEDDPNVAFWLILTDEEGEPIEGNDYTDVLRRAKEAYTEGKLVKLVIAEINVEYHFV